ncbi:nucleoside hydrolase [Aliiroseovarius sp. 2305UL8-7]|uniref:nucleoside hydrolase n=1 Tax=Aliiroseovarius conchicola TaxID=3121637 RepID=UPI00352864F1
MKQKIILDCDPGIDDALAILFALGLEELDIHAVTTVSGNRPVDQTFENARRIVALGGRPETPVFKGAFSPLDQTAPRSNLVHGADGLGGISLPQSAAPIEARPAAIAILDILRDSPEGEVTLVAIGPLTNLALAFALDPTTIRRAKRLAIMGGSIHYPGNVTTVAEFNVWADQRLSPFDGGL